MCYNKATVLISLSEWSSEYWRYMYNNYVFWFISMLLNIIILIFHVIGKFIHYHVHATSLVNNQQKTSQDFYPMLF